MWATVMATCLWVGAVVLSSLLCWVALVAFSKLRPLRLLDRLPKRAVLITGCDSGFGEGLARRLDALGVPVFAGCLFPEGPGARRLAEECSANLRVLPLDVTSDKQIAAAFAAVQESLSHAPDTELWAVVNNAGISDCGEIDITPLEKFQQVMDVNTVGPIRVTKAFLPLLKKSKGRVVNVASPLGRFPFPVASAYCMSKSALVMFSDVLRLEMKRWSVTVSTMEPWAYGTFITDKDWLMSRHTENLKKTLSDVRTDCGEESTRILEAALKIMKWISKKDITDMVDEMVVACVGLDVQTRHTAGFKGTLLVTVLPKLPDWFREFTTHLLWKSIKTISV